MLKLMREKAGSWFIKVILGAIVVVFVFWGVGSFRSERANRVASVNGEPITMESYRQAYNNLLERYRRQFGKNLDDNMLKMLGINKQALDQLIDQNLILQEAARLGFRVSNKELIDSIRKMSAFQSDGVFDNGLYNRVLTLNRLTPEGFESIQRESMLTEKMRAFITDNVKVSNPEATEWYQWNNSSVSIEYVLFAPDSYKDIQASDDEVSAYYEENKDDYKTEAKVRARYLRFDPKAYVEKVAIGDEEISEYYEANTDDFKEAKTVEARHILFKLDKDSKPEDVEKKKQQAEKVLTLAKEGRDFAELAKEYSEGPTKDKGGYLGAFKKETMVKPFADKAFSMKAGEISEPVRTRFGWHLIKVEKVNEAKTLTLEESTKKIRKKLADERAKTLAYDAAEALYDSAFEGDNLKDVAATQNLTAEETDLFTRKGPGNMKNASKFAAAAFDLSPMSLSEVQDLGDGYYIIQVTEKILEEIAKFEDVKKKVMADVVKKKQEEKAQKDAEAMLAALKGGSTIEAEGPKYNVTSKTTGLFKRNAAIPDIGYEREISQAAFKLSGENKQPESPLKGRKGYYVIQFKERKLPESGEFEKEKQSVRERLLRQKQFKAFSEWLAQIREKSEIVIKEDFLN